MTNWFPRFLAFALAWLCAGPASRGLDIQFDYTYDTGGFFVGHPERQTLLNLAAQVFESRLADVLTGITPGSGNSWTAKFSNPSATGTINLPNLMIATGVVRVYAGARDLGGSTLGRGGAGGFGASGSQAFVENVAVRGQAGGLVDPPTDFGPWGGSISFDIDTTWYFDSDITNMENIGTQSDFYSVAVHELAHLLGFGTAPSWDTYINGSTFTGPASMAEHGGTAVPLEPAPDLAHWADGTTSRVTTPVSLAMQEAAMDPSLFEGERKYFTELDYAGLADVGWTVIPEPRAIAILLTGGTLLLTARWRRPAGQRLVTS